MTAPIEVALAAPEAGEDQTFPILTDAQMARVAAQGHLRQVSVGEVLADAGKPLAHFYDVTSGALDGLQLRDHGDDRVTTLRAGSSTARHHFCRVGRRWIQYASPKRVKISS